MTDNIALAIHRDYPDIPLEGCEALTEELRTLIERLVAAKWEFDLVELSARKRRRETFLGSNLRRLRLEAGLSQRDVCVKARWSVPKLSRIENGSRSISYLDLKFLLGIYRVKDQKLARQLLALARQPQQ